MTMLISATRAVKVSLDEEYFTEEWFAEFRSYMYEIEDITDVYMDLAEKYLAGIVDGSEDLIEGYGKPADFKLKFVEDDETRSYTGSSTHGMKS